MISLSTLLLYYKKPDIQKEMVSYAADKEVAVKFGDKGFGKRPDVLKYPNEVLELVKQGATSFHCSEELWHNPLQISTEMRPNELASLRKGWDLVLDIDCKELAFSAIAADLLIKALKHHGISSVSSKFSGNHGFHIAIPFEAFPERVHNIPTKDLFPDGPRKIAEYLQHMIKDPLESALLNKYSTSQIAELSGKKFEEIVINSVFEPFNVVGIDTILIASRHLYRMPYSINEKSGLISVPVNPDRILQFHKAAAHPKNIRISKFRFLDTARIIKGEASKLIVQAFDFKPNVDNVEAKGNIGFEELQQKAPFELFPPCIKLIDKGVKDGRKRSVFILLNFLRKSGWGYDDIEKYLLEWNKRNAEPLRDVSILGPLRYHKHSKKNVLPPNCAAKSYYKDIGVCQPDNLCARINNPLSYVRRKVFAIKVHSPPTKSPKKEQSL